jgi:uncharacterized protein
VRLVLDTNVALSGLLWQGVPGSLIEAAETRQIVLVATIPLLAELRGVLQREKFQRRLRARAVAIDDLLDGYLELVEIVPPAELSATVARDPTDDVVLAAALAGGADLIVSGDAHLLNLKRFQDIAIVTPIGAMEHLSRSAPPT